MGGWRTKLIFLLIVYFAGFATAIYCLAPVPENQADGACEKSFVNSAFKSDEFAQSFNTGMHKCVDFAKDAAWRTGGYLKQKLDDRHQNDS
jgi:hypothetical protein